LFQVNLKIHQARQALKTGAKISTLATDLGFSDQSHFHKVFKAHAGVTPKQYQQGFSALFYNKIVQQFPKLKPRQ
jgi:AraC-like DNA-binding protein